MARPIRTTPGVRAIALVALTASGCPVALPTSQEIRFTCNSGDDCTAGYVCRNGYCTNANALSPDGGVADTGRNDSNGVDLATSDRVSRDRNAIDNRLADSAPTDRPGPGDSQRPDTADASATDRVAADIARDGGARDSIVDIATDTTASDTTAPDATTPDATAPDQWAADAADAGSSDALTVVCDLQSGNWSFTPPEPVTEINSAVYDRDPWLTPNGLTIYFSSERPGGQGSCDIWFATRPDRSSPFNPPVNAGDFNTDSNDARLSLTFDLLTAFLSTSRPGGLGGVDIWSATRATADDPFAAFALVANVNSASSDDHDPLISHDGLRLYFAPSAHPQTMGGQDLVIAMRAQRSVSFAAPVVLANVNSASGDADPSLTYDEHILLFASFRSGGQGSSDIYYATRPNLASDFGTPLPMPVINSASADGDPFITGDGCELYFYSDRSGGTGSADIWRARFQVQ